MGEWDIDKKEPEEGEDDDRGELHPLRRGSEDQDRRDDREGELENAKDILLSEFFSVVNWIFLQLLLLLRLLFQLQRILLLLLMPMLYNQLQLLLLLRSFQPKLKLQKNQFFCYKTSSSRVLSRMDIE